MVWGNARSYRLSEQDAEDVSQTTWLQLATHLRSIEEPAAAGGWLATTARRESARLASRRAREVLTEPEEPAAAYSDGPVEHGEDVVLRAERRRAVRRAFAELPESCQRLLALLMKDPAPSYEEVSALLGMPRGSIGPTRARCLSRLRKVMEM